MTKRTYREKHGPKGPEDDPFCGDCGTDYPCDVRILLDVVDAAKVLDKHYGAELRGEYPYGWGVLMGAVERAERL